MSKKLIIGIVILLLLGAGVLWWMGERQDVEHADVKDTVTIDEEVGADNASDSVATVDTSDWETFTHVKNRYTLKHPKDMVVEGADFGGPPPQESGAIVIRRQDGNEDDVFFVGSRFDTVHNQEPPLEEYVQGLYDLNIESVSTRYPNTIVDEVMELFILGADGPAYLFSVDGVRASYGGGTQYSSSKYPIIFAEHGGRRYVLEFEYNDPTARTIFDSFEFIDN